MTFRIALTPRMRGRQFGEWSDGEALWLGCRAYAEYADNIAASLRFAPAQLTRAGSGPAGGRYAKTGIGSQPDYGNTQGGGYAEIQWGSPKNQQPAEAGHEFAGIFDNGQPFQSQSGNRSLSTSSLSTLPTNTVSSSARRRNARTTRRSRRETSCSNSWRSPTRSIRRSQTAWKLAGSASPAPRSLVQTGR